ncbi:MAG: hemolysin secretion protein D [Sulfurimonas sp. RIFOXYD12_FULL_33_39]|uniref:HlyD family type I secretion periplasmic adaptor subunit n=1 Tax=unclassified Sulfurimonas TaxID=2623549 RepID=UPI0008B221B8|nr:MULTISPECIES: HlyD family type I secretion periplasmic adaptor subunit [unclassified Sulfurimonas]OHE10181.1 MAG: hemolysin secretion protein D [Sulfurimonas sp. RIFOXYD12_FULL_33_39]OHE14598.1 MAG: hemolysin secretion protein D [Sulfurimonas sp. RIFOXYD2_FULL_34_21]DAB28305.1 MAG TPA: hemolysin secretion protein D [Sulfurimonas sp. UBA10385]
MKKDTSKVEYTEKDYEFMKSLSSAILEKTPSRISRVLRMWVLTTILIFVWASFAEIDEITRGGGKVVPFGQNKIIQNLEGGIVESILINEGQYVKEGQIILKINNSMTTSTSETNEIKFMELKAKKMRLYAEANNLQFEDTKVNDPAFAIHVKREKELYQSDIRGLNAKNNSIITQIEQKKQGYEEAKARIKTLQISLEYVKEEVAMTEPMVREGVKSKVDFLKLKREENGIQNDIEASKLSLPRLLEAIKEQKNKLIEAEQTFMNTAKKELNEISAELERLTTQQVAFSDQVSRTMVKSPVEGIVQKLYVNTVGGVIKPGADLVEIVPTDKRLYLEVKIKPSDIAYLHPGAMAKVKVSAYDFAIYGSLVGEVVNISPDTTVDEKGETFYIINIETEKNYLGTQEQPQKIIPGMTVDVDIVTGRKTVMQYLLKPILKSKQYVFSER